MAGTVTLMFTDLVGSTELLGRLGEDGAAAVRRRHFGMLRDALAQAGGREVKSLGDGLMVAFDSAAAAVSCARAIQAGAAAEPDGVGVRIGLHAGEPDREEDDFFGTPVVVASRLCDRAAAGQILASELVRGLAGTRHGAAFRPLGALTLKGLDEPITAWEIVWVDGADAAPAPAPAVATGLRAPLPAELLRGDTAFAGRADALAAIRAELDAARDEGLRLVLVTGEPGIGKSRLAAEAARVAHADGAVVLFGRCDEEGLVPYQPFAEALRTYLGSVPAAAPLADGLERLSGAVPLAPSKETDPAAERLALFESVAGFLASVSRAGPVFLIVDDLHWADGPTLALLRHLVRRGRDVPALVLGTYRDTDLARTHPLAAALAELRRERAATRISLFGLEEPDVSEMLAAAAGHQPPGAFVRALQEETEGNPFFIEEIVRHLVETGTIVQRDGRWTSDRAIEDMGIPEGVREAVGRRLSCLGEAANRALADASVLGSRFEFDVLAALSALEEEALLDALDEALRAQLVVDATDSDIAAYAFRHALVRETLYEELSLPRRQRLHLRAADAIEATHARDLDAHAGALALHLRLAGAAVEPARALDWTLRAAQASAGQLAWEEAESQLATALELMDEAGAGPAERAPLHERLADLRYVTNADLQDGLHGLKEALAGYEKAGDTGRVARIHSKLARHYATYWGPTMDIGKSLEHIDAARALMDDRAPSTAAAALETAAATAHLATLDGVRAREASRRALEIGHALEHPLLILNAEALDAFIAAGQEATDGDARLERAWEEANRRNHPWLSFVVTWLAGALAFWEGGPRRQGAVHDRELATPRSHGALGQQRIIGSFRAQATAAAGLLEEAEAAVAAHPMPDFPVSHVTLTLMRESPQRAAEMALEMAVGHEACGNHWSTMLATLWGAEAACGCGDPVTTAIISDAVVEAFEDGGFPTFAAYERGLAAWRNVLAGRLDAAREHVARGRETACRNSELGRARMLVAEAAIAAAEGNGDAADDGFAAGVEALQAVAHVWHSAEALRAWGVLTRSIGPIDAALEIYERIGAAPEWAALARSEREQAGATVA